MFLVYRPNAPYDSLPELVASNDVNSVVGFLQKTDHTQVAYIWEWSPQNGIDWLLIRRVDGRLVAYAIHTADLRNAAAAAFPGEVSA